MKSPENLVSQCDSLIRAGRAQEVARLLRRINLSNIARKDCFPIAKICRRAGLYGLGLKILGSIVNPSTKKSRTEATSEERAEYAVLLLRIGAVTEATARLNAISPQLVPDVHLYRAFGHFLHWESSLAVTDLERYLAGSLTDYARLVGNTNLSLAHV